MLKDAWCRKRVPSDGAYLEQELQDSVGEDTDVH